MENKEYKDMMTQETKLVKTWEWFNLAILKLNRIHYERIEVYTITTKNVGFSRVFLGGVYKNAAIDSPWAAFAKRSPKINSIAAFLEVWAAFLWVGLRPRFKNAAIDPSIFYLNIS